MYLRETKRRNADGSEVSYLALAQNERDPVTGVSRAQIVHRFGRADQVDREALARLQAAQADLAALSSGEAGTLHIGTYQSVGARILPEVMTRFRASWPAVDIRLRESADDAELLGAVENGGLDLTFVILPVEPGPFEVTELLSDPYVLVVAAGSELAERGTPPTMREISKLPLIGYRQCRSVHAVEERLRATGASDPNIVFRSDDNGTVQGLVAAGVGAALVPRLSIDASDEKVAVLELGSKMPPRLIGIAWHRDRYHSPAARAFVETAQAVCAPAAELLVVA